ncbi:MAG: hypothetical protein LBS30_00420, partial [Planctomycetota bacterium]|nr:hypothetical protein [Planctomycetota bacterium]
MAFSSIQNQNMHFSAATFSRAAVEPNQPNTVTNIAATMRDSFDRRFQISTLQTSFVRKLNSVQIRAQPLPAAQNTLNVAEWDDRQFSDAMMRQRNSSLSVDMSVAASMAGGGAATSTGDSALDARIAVNMQQAQQIRSRLSLDSRVDW